MNADIVGVSALLTTTMRNQKDVVQAIEKAGLRSQIRIMVGGAPVTRRWAEEIGADGYAKDAMSAVTLAQELIQQKLQSTSYRRCWQRLLWRRGNRQACRCCPTET